MRMIKLFLLAFVLMMLTINIDGTVTIYDNAEGCRDGCEQIALGFPLPFFYNSPYFSPADSVSIAMILTGDDEVHWRNFTLSFLFWFFISWLLFRLGRKRN